MDGQLEDVLPRRASGIECDCQIAHDRACLRFPVSGADQFPVRRERHLTRRPNKPLAGVENRDVAEAVRGRQGRGVASRKSGMAGLLVDCELPAAAAWQSHAHGCRQASPPPPSSTRGHSNITDETILTPRGPWPAAHGARPQRQDDGLSYSRPRGRRSSDGPTAPDRGVRAAAQRDQHRDASRLCWGGTRGVITVAHHPNQHLTCRHEFGCAAGARVTIKAGLTCVRASAPAR